MRIESIYKNLSVHIQHRNSRSHLELIKVPIKKDTVEISLQARKKQYSNGLEALSSLTHIKGKQIELLQAHNSVLEFKTGSYYRFTFDGLTTIMTGHENGSVGEPYDEMISELGVPRDFFGARDESESIKLQKISKIERFFRDLSVGISGTFVDQEFTNTEQKDLLATVGIKEGFFEVKSGMKSNKFYLQNDGVILPNYQMIAQRSALNRTDLFKIGYTKGETLTVGGKAYEIDDKGHVHVPDDVAVLYGNVCNIEKRYGERLVKSIKARSEQIDLQRTKINNANLFDYGFSEGDILKSVGGLEFKIDETGHVNLPRGAALIPSERLERIFNS